MPAINNENVKTPEPEREHAPPTYPVGQRSRGEQQAGEGQCEASITHCRSEKLAPSPRWIDGNATFTIETSSSSMKIAVQPAISVHHLRASVRRSSLSAGVGDVALLRVVARVL
jgi:hypothetical protein